MGKKLLSGSVSLSTTPFPVSLFEPRSYLEKLADVYVYPRFLKEAASAQPSGENQACRHLAGRRITQVELMADEPVMSPLSPHSHPSRFGERWKKPFNPILGETWQASFVRWLEDIHRASQPPSPSLCNPNRGAWVEIYWNGEQRGLHILIV